MAAFCGSLPGLSREPHGQAGAAVGSAPSRAVVRLSGTRHSPKRRSSINYKFSYHHIRPLADAKGLTLRKAMLGDLWRFSGWNSGVRFSRGPLSFSTFRCAEAYLMRVALDEQ